MRYCGHFLIKAEGGAKNYKRDHPLPLAWRSFTVTFVQQKGYIRETHFSGAVLGLRNVGGVKYKPFLKRSNPLETGTKNDFQG